MNLKPALLLGILDCGFFKPYPLQQRVLTSFLQGRDVVVQSPNRTGKKTTFALTVLQNIDASNSECQALILVPFKESAQEVQRVIQTVGKFTEAKCHVSVGGTNIINDMMGLNRGRHIVVGTTGRICDMISRRSLRTHDIKTFVMNDADELLMRGLSDQMYEILKNLPERVQMVVAAKTISSKVFGLMRHFMRDPVRLTIEAGVEEEKPDLSGVRQFFVTVDIKEQKLRKLCDLLTDIRAEQSVIFCNTRDEVDILVRQLRQPTVAGIHGHMHQNDRDAVFERFHNGAFPVLVTTER
ncbi:uncharacterized protein LOC129586086 [Paramacrobiotus metropolitanus]|uniref:uncharacterized protein LOC129586086 n=1 Tax=Paramacrobiotus metropolitanus TaxID=2943436 RepID=UPI0024463521|nr:uncharacterized protein LOC129586086 [Paramacrobiotus metropolitanus]